LHRGGAGRPVALEEPFRRAALDATRIIGLDVAGVDMLESKSGPLVIEVNSSPGLRGVERATHVDVASRVVMHAERLVSAAPGARQET
jgi:ribosomal protein S6--L-glutamate ligase